MPGIDKPTGRVVALIVLLIVVAAALRGYLPAHHQAPRADSGSSPAAMVAVVAALAGTVTLLAVAVIARLRDPRAISRGAADLPELLGTGAGRPRWRALLIGLLVIVALLTLLSLLTRLAGTHEIPAPAPPREAGGPASAPTGAPPPRQQPHGHDANMAGVLLACTLPLLVVLVAGSVIESRRRWRAAAPQAVAVDGGESPPQQTRPESLVRAAERGLAEMTDLGREPREAIIACYAAMERELANVPGAVPQDFDTPTEVLARAVEHHVLHADNATGLVDLFVEARFSAHLMNEGHRDAAVRTLQLVLTELRSASRA
jgi:hypothetical protein